MITNAIFTVPDKTGILGEVTVALLNSGFQIEEQSMSPAEIEGQSLIKVKLEADKAINEDDLNVLKVLVPEITSIDCGNKSSTAAVIGSNHADHSELVKAYFDKLVEAYPQLGTPLEKINDEVDETLRNEILTKVGRALGKRQYKKDFALGGLLSVDKTLHRMLRPCLKSFLELEEFEFTTPSSVEITLLNCPVCRDRVSASPDCGFISEFIDGFLSSVPNIERVSVIQTQSKASGGRCCVFELECTAG